MIFYNFNSFLGKKFDDPKKMKNEKCWKKNWNFLETFFFFTFVKTLPSFLSLFFFQSSPISLHLSQLTLFLRVFFIPLFRYSPIFSINLKDWYEWLGLVRCWFFGCGQTKSSNVSKSLNRSFIRCNRGDFWSTLFMFRRFCLERFGVANNAFWFDPLG